MEGFPGTSSPRRAYTVVRMLVLEGTKGKHGWQANSGDGDTATHSSLSTLIIDTNKVNIPFYLLWLPFTV